MLVVDAGVSFHLNMRLSTGGEFGGNRQAVLRRRARIDISVMTMINGDVVNGTLGRKSGCQTSVACVTSVGLGS